MPYRQTIPSDFMAGPRLADLLRAAAPPPSPRAGAAEPLHPAFQKGIDNLGDGRDRDAVRGAPEREPAFSYRTDPALLDRLPPASAALLRRLDRACTEARDTTIALGRQIDEAGDRIGRASLDIRAAIQAARLAEVQTLDEARAMAALGRWPTGFTDPMKAQVARIIAEGQRHAEAEAERAELVQRRNGHNARTAPLTALRQRLVEGAARLRPPIRALELPEVPASKAERVMRDARETIAEARAEIARIEAAKPHPDDAEALAREAVARYGAESGLRSVLAWNGSSISITEAVPGLSTEDRRPLRPLALLAAIAPDLVAAAIARTIGTDPDAPPVADRPRLLAELRARLREAELAERAAIRAMDDPLDMFRPDADAAITLMVEAGR